MRRMNGIALASAALALVARAADAQVAVRGETVYTMAGAPIRDGVVLVGADGKIERVGPAAEVQIPAGYRMLTGRVVTPGLVDAHSVVGLAGAMGQPHDQDQLDRDGGHRARAARHRRLQRPRAAGGVAARIRRDHGAHRATAPARWSAGRR